MCGILGAITPHKISEQKFYEALLLLKHRGPDESGFIHQEGFFLGCERLKIIDLQSGTQPLCNEDGKIWIVFNGEIYNYRELREELITKGHKFRTNSDTEVIVHLYEQYQEQCVNYLEGMFAFGIYDVYNKTCFLARDRFGIKPLFFYEGDDIFLFSSEISPILALLDEKPQISSLGLNFYFWLDYIPSPYTIYEGIYSLLPGHCMKVIKGKTECYQYYHLDILEVDNMPPKFAIDQLKFLIEKSVRYHLVSDVELGLFLSGGLDSSILALEMSKKHTGIKSFTIGFDQPSYDESIYAKTICNRLNLNNIHHLLSCKDLVEIFLDIVARLEQPFGDHSLLPTYFLSQLASKFVKAVICGDGGDEVFLGYQTYIAHKIFEIIKYIPGKIRRNFLRLIMKFAPCSDRYFSLNFCIQRFLRSQSLDEIQRHIHWMESFGSERQYLLSCFQPVEEEYIELILNKYIYSIDDTFSRIQAFDIYTYLSNDILYKTDFSSMRNSLEVRVPFLAHWVVEFGLSLPSRFKLSKIKSTKYILRQAYKDKLPPEIYRKKKAGFSLPTARLIRMELRDVLYNYIKNAPSFIRREYVLQLFRQHCNNIKDNRKLLWNLLIFLHWYENNY